MHASPQISPPLLNGPFHFHTKWLGVLCRFQKYIKVFVHIKNNVTAHISFTQHRDFLDSSYSSHISEPNLLFDFEPIANVTAWLGSAPL